MVSFRKASSGLAVLGLFVLSAGATRADVIVTNNNSAADLATALTAGNTGIIVTSVSFSGVSQGTLMNSGIYRTTVPGNTYNLENTGPGSGIVLTTGNAASMGTAPAFIPNVTTGAYGVPATPAQEMLLQQISAPVEHFDVAQLTIGFNIAPTFPNSVSFNVVFASAEWPGFVMSPFNDAFGVYLNGTAASNNLAFVDGAPVNIDHPAMMESPPNTSILRGVLAPGGNPVLSFSGSVNPTDNQLTFVLGDSGDELLDTTVWITALGTQSIPEPPSLVLAGVGLLVLAGYGGCCRCRALRSATLIHQGPR